MCTILLYNLFANQPHVVIVLELYKVSEVTLCEKFKSDFIIFESGLSPFEALKHSLFFQKTLRNVLRYIF